MVPTRIEDIQAMGGRAVVELSGWTKDKPFACELRRLGLYETMAAGYVPNPLIPVVQDLFMGMQKAIKSNMSDPDDAKAMVAIARAAMVQPSYQQLEEAGVQLTDQQVLEIFFFATRGPAALAAFRDGPSIGNRGNGKDVPDAPQRADGD